MSKPILIAMLVVLLAGGGIAFAQTEAVSGLLGLAVTPETEDGDEDQSFGEEASDAAQELGQEMDPDEIIPDVAEKARAKEDRNGEGEENRSDVAEAVLKVLGGESSPGDDNFGDNVSKQAQDDGRKLGEKVSDAAKGTGKELGGNAPDAAGNANSKAGNAR